MRTPRHSSSLEVRLLTPPVCLNVLFWHSVQAQCIEVAQCTAFSAAGTFSTVLHTFAACYFSSRLRSSTCGRKVPLAPICLTRSRVLIFSDFVPVLLIASFGDPVCRAASLISAPTDHRRVSYRYDGQSKEVPSSSVLHQPRGWAALMLNEAQCRLLSPPPL